jgi:hypothetical protein
MTVIRKLWIPLVFFVSACGSVTAPGSAPNDFSSGNFTMNIVASNACPSLADAGRNRSWNVGLEMTGSAVTGYVQGWADPATVVTQVTLAGTANGRMLSLTGSIYETIVGCEQALCYRAEGSLTAMQTGNVLSGTFNGAVGYGTTSCTAADHQVTLTRR